MEERERWSLDKLYEEGSTEFKGEQVGGSKSERGEEEGGRPRA